MRQILKNQENDKENEKLGRVLKENNSEAKLCEKKKDKWASEQKTEEKVTGKEVEQKTTHQVNNNQ